MCLRSHLQPRGLSTLPCHACTFTVLLHPGGSIADEGVVSACNEYNMAMAFTGTRLFHH